MGGGIGDHEHGTRGIAVADIQRGVNLAAKITSRFVGMTTGLGGPLTMKAVVVAMVGLVSQTRDSQDERHHEK